MKSSASTQIDIVEGTYKMFKVETLKLLAPMKIYIKYRSRRGGGGGPNNTVTVDKNTGMPERARSSEHLDKKAQ